MVVVGRREQTLATLAFSTLISLVLLAGRELATGSNRYWFLLWNLLLAWLPLIFAGSLRHWLRQHYWLTWQGVALTWLWLIFLPNSFYLSSDLVHIHQTGEISLLYDTVLFLSFIWNGLVLGYFSLFIVHGQLIKRLRRRTTHGLIALILLLCSFAIYLGRSLRWNSWDAMVNPAGLLLDVSERVLHPLTHPQAMTTTLMFFVLLGGLYVVIWQFIKIIVQSARPRQKDSV